MQYIRKFIIAIIPVFLVLGLLIFDAQKTHAANCPSNPLVSLQYPDLLHLISKKASAYKLVNAKYQPQSPKVKDKELSGAKVKEYKLPPNMGQLWIPKAACGKEVDLIIAMHGHRSFKHPGINVFVGPSSKGLDQTAASFMSEDNALPVIIGAPMYDRGPKQNVWDKFSINDYMKKVAAAIKPYNMSVKRVSIIGHSNANCNGGATKAAKALSGYPLYIYGAADGTCSTYNFIKGHNVIQTVKSKGGILFHMHAYSEPVGGKKVLIDVKESKMIKALGGGGDPDVEKSAQKGEYMDAWKSSDGTVFTYTLTDGGNKHGIVPNMLLKEILPRFFMNEAYNPKSAPPKGTSQLSSVTGVKANTSFDRFTDGPIKLNLLNPRLIIKIPGVNFSSVKVADIQTTKEGAKLIVIPFLGEYLKGVYQYAVMGFGILAIIMIIISGVQWTLFGSTEQKSEIQKRIIGALSGLLLAVSSYVILYTINPKLVAFEGLKVVLFGKDLTFTDGMHEDLKNSKILPEMIQKYCPNYNWGTYKSSGMNIRGCMRECAKTATYKSATTSAKYVSPLANSRDIMLHGELDCAAYGTRGTPTVIGIHDGGSAGGNVSHWNRRTMAGKLPLGTHYTITQNGAIYQTAAENLKLHHGIRSSASIGIDLQRKRGCPDAADNCYTSAQYSRLKALIRDIERRHKRQMHVLGHCEVNKLSKGHYDPRSFNWAAIGEGPVLAHHRGRCIYMYGQAERNNPLTGRYPARVPLELIKSGKTGGKPDPKETKDVKKDCVNCSVGGKIIIVKPSECNQNAYPGAKVKSKAVCTGS